MPTDIRNGATPNFTGVVENQTETGNLYTAWSYIDPSGATTVVEHRAARLDSNLTFLSVTRTGGGYSDLDYTVAMGSNLNDGDPAYWKIDNFTTQIKGQDLLLTIAGHKITGTRLYGRTRPILIPDIFHFWPSGQQSIEFSDLPVGAAFHDEVDFFVKLGAINGYEDHTFRPGSPLTRGQMSKVVVLGMKKLLGIR